MLLIKCCATQCFFLSNIIIFMYDSLQHNLCYIAFLTNIVWTTFIFLQAKLCLAGVRPWYLCLIPSIFLVGQLTYVWLGKSEILHNLSFQSFDFSGPGTWVNRWDPGGQAGGYPEIKNWMDGYPAPLWKLVKPWAPTRITVLSTNSQSNRLSPKSRCLTTFSLSILRNSPDFFLSLL